MSASGQSWKQEVSVPCVRSPVTALTRRMHPLRFAGRLARLIGCWNADYANPAVFSLDIRPGPTLMGSHDRTLTYVPICSRGLPIVHGTQA